MWQNFSMVPAFIPWQIWMAQVPVQPTLETPEEASVLFSGPQFFVALIAGVVLAFAFQLLLTNLSVAAGISFLGTQTNPDKLSQDHQDNNSDSFGDTINKIGLALGLGTLITVTIAIFLASLLAVKLSLIISPALGAIVGLVIWATYFSLLVWVSSTTVGSLVGSVVNTATSGFQALFGTAAAALGAQAAKKQMISTVEATAAAVRRELGSAIDPVSLRETVEDYLSALKPPELDLASVRQQFENILNDPQLKEVASSGDLPNLDRQTFVNLVSSRSDLSKRDVNRLADQLESTWRQATGGITKSSNQLDELVNYMKSANPADLLSNQLGDRLEKLVNELSQRRKAQQPNMFQQGITMGLNSLMGVVLGRTDLSDFDVEKILGQLKSAQEKVTTQTDRVAAQIKGETKPYSTLKTDAENYVLNARSWKMNRMTIDRDFRDVLYDPAANPSIIRHDLEQLSRSDFVSWLSQRGLFTQAKIQELASELEAVRLSVLYTVAAEEEQENTQQMLRQAAYYLRVTSKEELNEASFEQKLKPLLADENAGYEQIRARMEKLDRPIIIKMLSQRQDLNQDEARSVILQIEAVRDRVVAESKEKDEQAIAQLVGVRQNLESYLRSTGKNELNPDGIKRDVKMLLSDPNAGMWALRARAERFDRDTLVKLLATREEISEAEAHRIIDQVESTWNSIVYTPKAIAGQAKEQYDKVMGSLADYLRSTGKDELNPDGIKRDLAKLLDDPQSGASALRYRLSQIDRDTLVQLLAQRQDMTQEQANEVVDNVQNTIRDIIRTPRRVATRVQQQVNDFQSTLEDYLRSTGKDELNPEGIKRDLSLLLHDPSVGAVTLKDRLAQFDRSTIVSLLSQREDISEAEANRIVDQILSVRDQFLAQIQNIQARIQSVIDSILANIRNYLNSLDRPELNYDGIKRDVRKLFHDPEAGFDAMRNRLSQVNRDTLVAIMSSREDVSQADANRIIDQIEAARNNVIQRAENLQNEAQRRLEELRQEALRRGEETRKAAESAAWWLFFTALVSAVAAAGAGAIAVAS